MALFNGRGAKIDDASILINGNGVKSVPKFNGYGEMLGLSNVYCTSDLMSAVDTAENTVNGYSGAKIAYITDLHCSGNGQLMQGKNTVNPYWSLAVLEEVCKRGLVEAVVMGGDLINAYAGTL